MAVSEPLVIGVDAGATNLRIRLARADGTVLRNETHPAGRWTEMGIGDQVNLLSSRIGELISAGRDELAGTVVGVGVGAHGCDSDEECLDFERALTSHIGLPCQVVNDAVLLQLAHNAYQGASLVVGTGSIAVGFLPDGTSLYAGGWGWLFSDPGSGWGIVREAARQLAHAMDAGTDVQSDPLQAALVTASGSQSLRQVVEVMQTRPAQKWAAWAPGVFAAAAQGSPLALAAIETAAIGLCGLIENLLSRGAVISKVVAGGGVVVHQPMLAERLSSLLRERLGLGLELFTGDASAGAVVLASRRVESAARVVLGQPTTV